MLLGSFGTGVVTVLDIDVVVVHFGSSVDGGDGRGVVTVFAIDVVEISAGLVAIEIVVVGKLTAGLVAFGGIPGGIFAGKVVKLNAAFF